MTQPPDFPDFTPSGVALTSATPIAQKVTSVLTPGQVVGPVTYQIAQLGYELQFQASGQTGSAGPDYVTFLMSWMDSTTGITVWEKAYSIAVGPHGDAHQICASGPARADQVVVTITALASNPDSISCTYTLLQTSRSYTRDRARTTSSATANFLGLIAGGYVIESGNLLNVSASGVAAGGSAVRVIGFWDGEISIVARTSLASATMDVSVSDLTGLQGNDAAMYHEFANSAGDVNATPFIPSLQCALTLHNNATTSATLSAAVTAATLDT